MLLTVEYYKNEHTRNCLKEYIFVHIIKRKLYFADSLHISLLPKVLFSLTLVYLFTNTIMYNSGPYFVN